MYEIMANSGLFIKTQNFISMKIIINNKANKTQEYMHFIVFKNVANKVKHTLNN